MCAATDIGSLPNRYVGLNIPIDVVCIPSNLFIADCRLLDIITHLADDDGDDDL